MVAPNLTLIVDVDITRDDLTFKLRVINLWHQMCFYKKKMKSGEQNPSNGLQKKHISIQKCSQGWDGILHQRSKLCNTKDGIRDSHSSKKPLLQSVTIFLDPSLGFHLFDYQNVLSFAHPQDTSVDVMGLVVAVAEMQRDHPYKSKHKLNINIQDAKGLQLHVNLWGDYAYKMQEYIHNNPHNCRIILIL
uniref:Replication protein A OB domain-containing protein n=1 Tax=Lactuca sativa TaxID=4236 RepID=A0A9R1W022_LACSA|nr:hypothetical protein LSAT_V11C400182090 [Lactuca sativa]